MTSHPTPVVSAELKTAIGEVVETMASEIRAKARNDAADDLDQAGHTSAAEWLRDHK
ncbi:hypothetical protein JOF41_007352 [Saccharothrix coeruleofusca]|uniref:hypothetical protein n=1 Tax=Saccharothrix coeruleofusca TaxID=33919 RepID=UPI001AE3947F|nr:hypothetical protein [Saccharothrix coeruleofusca]MBP2341098.1 hypothetical protein [Saccharothrix coeruleofusca]